MVFYMYYTVGWLSSNGNYSSGNPANKLSGFVGALLSKEITIGKEGGPCRHFVWLAVNSVRCSTRIRCTRTICALPHSVRTTENIIPKSSVYVVYRGDKEINDSAKGSWISCAHACACVRSVINMSACSYYKRIRCTVLFSDFRDFKRHAYARRGTIIVIVVMRTILCILCAYVLRNPKSNCNRIVLRYGVR